MLGPLLFMIYINDLVEVVASETRIFADDTFIFQVIDEEMRNCSKLNDDLQKNS